MAEHRPQPSRHEFRAPRSTWLHGAEEGPPGRFPAEHLIGLIHPVPLLPLHVLPQAAEDVEEQVQPPGRLLLRQEIRERVGQHDLAGLHLAQVQRHGEGAVLLVLPGAPAALAPGLALYLGESAMEKGREPERGRLAGRHWHCFLEERMVWKRV